MKIYHSNGVIEMYDINHELKEVIVDTSKVPIGSVEDRIIKGLMNRGYTVRERSKCTALVPAEKPKEPMYKKFEVLYQMRKTETGEFGREKYIARLFAKNEDEVWKSMESSFVKVVAVYGVGKVRSDYLKKHNKKFHAIGDK